MRAWFIWIPNTLEDAKILSRVDSKKNQRRKQVWGSEDIKNLGLFFLRR